MKGLILKDFYVIKIQIIIYVMLAVLYLFLSFLMGNPYVFMGVIVAMTGMMPLTAISCDERSKWDKYGLTMPVSRRKMVVSKYIGVLMLLAGCVALVTVINFIAYRSDFVESTQVLVYILAATIAFTSVIMPIVYKIGSEKACFAVIAVICIPTALLFVIFTRIDTTKLSTVMKASVTQAGVTLLIISLACLYISYRVSVRIYSEKEW